MKNVVLNVEGMSCSHCVNAVTKAVTALDGVLSVNVDLEKKIAAIDWDEETVSLETIKNAIEEEGYDVI